MKKLLLIFVALFVAANSSQLYAQTSCSGGPNNCTIIPDVTASVVQNFSETGGFCNATINITFDLQYNNGLKFVNLYFFNNSIPPSVCGTAPAPTATGLGGYIALERISGSTFNKISVTLNGNTSQSPSTYQVTTTAITNGTRFVITGINFSKPAPCGVSEIVLYIGATNASSNGIQCYNSYSFRPYLLQISGKVDCTNPRNYDLILTSNYENPLGVSAPVSGTYDVYVDENRNQIVDPGEDKPISGRSFTTTVSGTTNIFSDIDVNLPSYLPGDPKTSSPLIIRVFPTTPGVAPVSGSLTNPCATLPVTFKSFNAQLRNGKGVLSWETATEENNKGFEVQRRIGNGGYQNIGFVASKSPDGNSNTVLSYSFEDASLPANSVAYYRLRQVDIDGKAAFSEIRSLRNNGKVAVSLYPNPSRGTVNISIPSGSGLFDVSLDDYTGRSIQRWTHQNTPTLQINNLKSGVYMLRIYFRDTGEQLVERVLVQ